MPGDSPMTLPVVQYQCGLMERGILARATAALVVVPTSSPNLLRPYPAQKTPAPAPGGRNLSAP
jgi:hypothetical protein